MVLKAKPVGRAYQAWKLLFNMVILNSLPDKLFFLQILGQSVKNALVGDKEELSGSDYGRDELSN